MPECRERGAGLCPFQTPFNLREGSRLIPKETIPCTPLMYGCAPCRIFSPHGNLQALSTHLYTCVHACHHLYQTALHMLLLLPPTLPCLYLLLRSPSLVILSPDGRVLSRNARGAVLRNPEGFPWEGDEDPRYCLGLCSVQ